MSLILFSCVVNGLYVLLYAKIEGIHDGSDVELGRAYRVWPCVGVL